MGLSEQFQLASKVVLNFTKRPSNDELLKLYALYKQGSTGDISGKKPGILDIKGRKKYEAWEEVKGLDCESAQQQYVDFVESLKQSNS